MERFGNVIPQPTSTLFVGGILDDDGWAGEVSPSAPINKYEVGYSKDNNC
jgi:hypothetical protein